MAYRVGGHTISPQPAGGPIPCLFVVPGRTSESATVAVTGSGRLLYAPLVENSYPAPLDDRGPAVVAASDDGGARWGTLESGSPDHVLDVPPWMSRDPQTGRIWFASVLPELCGAEISWSDDGGRGWQTNPVVGCPGMGSMRILEGPPPPGGARPHGYPHVVYYCANLSDLSLSNLWCFRSLDGGRSFSFTGAFADPPPRPGCNTEHPARPGAVGPDGDLYFPVYQCGDLSVALSTDEGASWRLVHVATSQVQDLYISSMAADAAGDLYLAWNAGSTAASSQPGGPNPATEGILGQGTPMLSVSRDRGATWSAPVTVAPPGVVDARHIAVTAAGHGHVAISFLASSDGGSHLNGYLVETRDGGADWWGAALNDPATPLLNAGDSETFGNRLFNFTATFAPNGDAWAAFHCVASCAGRVGVVGRLAWPAPSAAPRIACRLAPRTVRARGGRVRLRPVVTCGGRTRRTTVRFGRARVRTGHWVTLRVPRGRRAIRASFRVGGRGYIASIRVRWR